MNMVKETFSLDLNIFTERSGAGDIYLFTDNVTALFGNHIYLLPCYFNLAILFQANNMAFLMIKNNVAFFAATGSTPFILDSDGHHATATATDSNDNRLGTCRRDAGKAIVLEALDVVIGLIGQRLHLQVLPTEAVRHNAHQRPVHHQAQTSAQCGDRAGKVNCVQSHVTPTEVFDFAFLPLLLAFCSGISSDSGGTSVNTVRRP